MKLQKAAMVMLRISAEKEHLNQRIESARAALEGGAS